MRLPRWLRRWVASATWAVGGRLPHWARRAVCATGAQLVPALPGYGPLPPGAVPRSGLQQWDATVLRALGRRPSPAERRGLVRSWLRNTLMSMSLSRWSDADVMARVRVADADLARLRDSLAGPGLVLVLPHMGSWDFAGAWCARVGIRVVSVAERLPAGLFERFRDARAAMGMTIHPVDQPDLMRTLADDVRAGRAVCLLGDRDLSGRGVGVDWPTPDGTAPASFPAGPALLGKRTGADLRVVTTRFDGDAVEILVGEPIAHGPVPAMLGAVAREFAAAVRERPTSWLMLQPFFRG